MAMRERFERWFVGEQPVDEERSVAPVSPTIVELTRVGEIAESLRAHLAMQENERTEVLRVLASLPEPLAALPRMAAQQDRLGETIGQALVHARQRDTNIDATLSRIVDGISQQTEVTGLIQQQLDLNLQAANGVAEGTTRLTEAVTELASSSRRGTQLLEALVEKATSLSESAAKERQAAHRWRFVVIALAATTVVLAVVIALLAWWR
ncbi:MAG: hypothetical protein FJ253_01030 [Phycisphaerae bacterium]|nr:hypothetical protein [Phycisphaerae bacterium]